MEKKEFIKKLTELLCQDPDISEHDLEYIPSVMDEYCEDLISLDDSISSGIIRAVEIYLDK